MNVTAYLHSSKESMYELGEKAGLDGEALHFFTYALCEVRVELEVDKQTGKAEIQSVDGRELMPPAAPLT